MFGSAEKSIELGTGSAENECLEDENKEVNFILKFYRPQHENLIQLLINLLEQIVIV